MKMIINKQDIFPVTIQKFQFNNEEIKPLLDEVHSKKNIIKKTSSFYTKEHSKDYFTDFKNTTKLYEYEKLINIIANKYSNEGYTLNLVSYWTAIYGKNSIHGAHQHDSIGVNFSSVLYLTNGGTTTFLAPHNTTTQRVYEEESTVGKLIFFPASLWHEAFYKGDSERIIISSNIQIIGNELD